MKTSRFLTSAAILATAIQSLGCAPEDSIDLFGAQIEDIADVENTAEGEAPLVNGTTTTDFAPVMRISWTGGNYIYSCTATAIADDMLVTASHCVKHATEIASYVKVSVAHGANSDASGKTSSYIIMSEDIYSNINTDTQENSYYYRDFAFIKFGAGTFSEYYNTITTQSPQPAWTVTKVGFGGDTTKEYATKSLVSMSDHDGGDYRVLYTSRTSGAYNEDGDSGGPLLKWNSSTSNYEVLGVVFGHGGDYDYHPSFTPTFDTEIIQQLESDLPKRCAEVYQHANYSGNAWSFCNDVSLDNGLDDFSDPYVVKSKWNFSDWNDAISSVELGTSNMVLTLYEHSSAGGSSVTFQNLFDFGDGSVVPSMGNEGFNDKVSSWSMLSGGSGTTLNWYLEVTRHGKCIDTSNTHSVGTNVYQWSCQADNDNQIFRIESVSGKYQIKHKYSGLCLGAENGGTANGTRIELQTCDSSTKQLFTMSSNTSTSSVRDFKVVNANSGKCLDLDSGSSSNGTAIQLWTCSDTNTNQNLALKRL